MLGRRAMSWDGNFGLRVVKSKVDGRGYGTVGYIDPGQKRFASSTAQAKIDFADGQSVQVGRRQRLHRRSAQPEPAPEGQAQRLPAVRRVEEHRPARLLPAGSVGQHVGHPAVAQRHRRRTASSTRRRAWPTPRPNWTTAAAGGSAVQYHTDVAFGFYSGNPNLKPMRANSFDLSGEWYFRGGMLSVGLFKKDVYDYIQSAQTLKTITKENGESVQAVGTVPQNMGHGEIYGVEFQYQQFYDFLPGPPGAAWARN
jgi:outer membrane receptor protein involved in Fe transport